MEKNKLTLYKTADIQKNYRQFINFHQKWHITQI